METSTIQPALVRPIPKVKHLKRQALKALRESGGLLNEDEMRGALQQGFPDMPESMLGYRLAWAWTNSGKRKGW
jgi:hypothetical protein